MAKIQTNLALYQLVTGLSNEKNRSLEKYLRALLGLVRKVPSPSLDEIARCLVEAMQAPPLPFEASWIGLAESLRDKDEPTWEETLLGQIVDLSQMKTAGTLEDKERYLGANAPSGARWYNYDPLTYLECGVRGAVGDGMSHRETGELDEDGCAFLEAYEDAKEIEGSWELLRKILGCGQYYE